MEILAPAGSAEKLEIAVAYGADAVYLAGPDFSLRSAAVNFSWDEIRHRVQWCHARQVKVYLTMNAYLLEKDMDRLCAFLPEIERLGCDAIIAADLGVIAAITRLTTCPIHVSTQASVLNAFEANFYKNFNIKRIILGREVTVQDAARIKEASDLEVELFIHGAMCMSYSGECVLSNYNVGRDSNRGGCVQTCRQVFSLEPTAEQPSSTNPASNPKELRSFLSSKDLNGLQVLKDFLRYGIDSVKIEGRMKSLLYVATTAGVYRRVLDLLTSGHEPDWDFWNNELEKLPHRGYTTGSLLAPANQNSVFSAGEKDKEFQYIGKIIGQDPTKQHYYMSVANFLAEGGELEFLTPQRTSVNGESNHSTNSFYQRMELSNFYDASGQSISQVQSGRVIRFFSPLTLYDNAIARTKAH